ncbi:helix-turn-helix domain-containing protein [Streptomyces sp. NPDC008139]|uniref:helix-turn-helix domain-containing protein n=1 Tax=Streptomyces sp. NPDC008139 TaxID=3364814 RepID=UPI0036E254DE
MDRRSDEDPPLIQEFLREARRNFAGEPEPITGHNGYRPPGLSQHAVAQRLGISPRLYQDWEGCGRPIPAHRLDSLANALRLDSRKRDELWFIVTGGYPPRGPAEPDPEAVTGWTSYLHALQVPALTVDGAWRILETNQAWRQLFEPAGQPPPANLLRFVLFAPYARQLCAEWRTGWATAFLRQLRLQAQTAHHQPQTGPDQELLRVIAELREDPELARLWQAESESTRVALHHDGQVRLLRPPAGGYVQRVRMLVSSPAHDPRRRVLMFMPAVTAPGLAGPAGTAPGTTASATTASATTAPGTAGPAVPTLRRTGPYSGVLSGPPKSGLVKSGLL